MDNSSNAAERRRFGTPAIRRSRFARALGLSPALCALTIADTFAGLPGGGVSHAQRTKVNICNRAPEFQQGILAAASGSPTCSTFTEAQLGAITPLTVTDDSSTNLTTSVFAGLSGLQTLDLNDSPSPTTVPANAFTQVASTVRNADLKDNGMASVHADAFDGLSNSLTIRLNENRISSLDENIFAGPHRLGNRCARWPQGRAHGPRVRRRERQRERSAQRTGTQRASAEVPSKTPFCAS